MSAIRVTQGAGPEMTIDIGQAVEPVSRNPETPSSYRSGSRTASTRVQSNNQKLGRIPNISFPPVTSCVPGVPCGTKEGCYAIKSWIQYTGCKNNWSSNYHLAMHDRLKFFSMVSEYLEWATTKGGYQPTMFRWHVSGDIPDQNYISGMKRIALEFPMIKFMAFTKQYDLKYTDLPKNLVIVLSMWPGYKTPKNTTLPRAWVKDPNYPDPRIPAKIFPCPGICEGCGYCWSRIKTGPNVAFVKH